MRAAKEAPPASSTTKRPAPSVPAQPAFKTSSSTSSAAAAGPTPKILVLDSSSPPRAQSRDPSASRGSLPPPRSFLEYDEGEPVAKVPARPNPLPPSSSPSGASGYFPRPADKRAGSAGKSRLGPTGSASVVPLTLDEHGKVVRGDAEDEDRLGTTSYRNPVGPSSSSSSVSGKKLIRYDSGATSPLAGTPLSSRQTTPGSTTSTSTAHQLASQLSGAFLDEEDDGAITRFANAFPQVSKAKVIKALEESGWETSAAADVLMALSPALPVPSRSAQPDWEVIGEDEDEQPANKQVSAIYAKRRTSDGDSREKKKKRRKANESDSGSGDDYGGESTQKRKSGMQKWERNENLEEQEALVSLLSPRRSLI